jgi:hypothetical protein
MNDNKDSDDIPSLKALVERYQETQAPAGFAGRIAARTRVEASPRGRLASSWVVAASFAVVVITTVVVMKMAFKAEPEIQLAQQDKPTPENTVETIPATSNKDSVVALEGEDTVPIKQDAPVAKVTEPVAVKQAQQKSQLANAEDQTDINPNWDGPVDENDVTSVAVLWEASDWLTEETVVMPDFSEMPALSEIDALFEKT